MTTKTSRLISIVLLAVLVLAVLTAIAGAFAKASLASRFPPPGELVDVGGYKMHLNCTGQGSPTVILASGMMDFSTAWAKVQPQLAALTRVCSYDRAGYGWSQPGTQPMSVLAQVRELHTLLTNADVPAPYLLVGHSLGGMHMRVYYNQYPDEVLGMVLVDSFHEERPVRIPQMTTLNQAAAQQFRMLSMLQSIGIMALAPQAIPDLGLPPAALEQYRAVLATTPFFRQAIAELNTADDSSAEARSLHITSLGDLPLTVISAGLSEPNPALSVAENQSIWEELQTEQTELTALSSAGTQIIAEQSGHYVQLTQPDLVINAIQEMLAAVQD